MQQDEQGKTDQSDKGQDLVTEVAMAMYGAALDRVRRHASEIDLKIEKLARVLTLAQKESDRSAAILLFAFSEDIILDAVQRYCNPKLTSHWQDLTGRNGLLATASNRITFAFLLRWIPEQVYRNLRILKDIRNRFAHHVDVDGFDDDKIRSWIFSLQVNDQNAYDLYEETIRPSPKTLSTRQLFLIRAALTLGHLVEVLAVAPEAIANRVDPNDARGEQWSEISENRKNVIRAVAQAVLDIVGRPLAQDGQSP